MQCSAVGPSAAEQEVLVGSWQDMDAVGNEMTLKKREELLEESYEACRQITKQYAKTFYLGTKLFDEEKRRAVWAVYAWCRRTDDIVDKPRKEQVSLRTELAEWGRRLKDVWAGRAHDVIDLALVDTVRNSPELAIEPFEDMIKARLREALAQHKDASEADHVRESEERTKTELAAMQKRRRQLHLHAVRRDRAPVRAASPARRT